MAAQLREAGAEPRVFLLDVTDEPVWRDLMQRITALGRLDLLPICGAA